MRYRYAFIEKISKSYRMTLVLTSTNDLETNLLFITMKVIIRATVYCGYAHMLTVLRQSFDDARSNQSLFLRNLDWAYCAIKLKYIINFNIFHLYLWPVCTHAHIELICDNLSFRFVYKFTRFYQILPDYTIFPHVIGCAA